MQDLLSRLRTLDANIEHLPINQMARDAGFVKRSPRKAGARQWLRAICLLTALPNRSFRSLGWLLGLIQANCHSKQNVGKRINHCFNTFIQEVLQKVAARLVSNPIAIKADPALKIFNRIIVQDSTIIGLPAHLAEAFPGSKNQTGKKTAGMRVQAFFDLLSESCLRFSISPFTSNDQKASADILQIALPGDLVLRDLGYSSLTTFGLMKQAGIDFLTRLRYGTRIFRKNGDSFDLLDELKDFGHLDIEVLVGAQTKLPVRLIAVTVPESVAAQRRRKARSDRDRRRNLSKEHLRLLGWTVLITTVTKQKLSADKLIRMYGLRWRIETLFKAWKSCFSFGHIPAYASAAFVSALVFARLLYVAVFQCLFQTLQREDSDKDKTVSPQKLASLIENLSAMELYSLIKAVPEDLFIATTLYHCRYDQRKRKHYYQILNDLSLG